MAEAAKLHDVPMLIEALEQQLETPVIPGEMPQWLETTQAAFAKLAAALPKCVNRRHQVMLDQIAEQDPGLLSRVEQLRAEDQQILEEANRQLKNLSALVAHDADVEPAEGRGAPAVEMIVSEGLKLIVRLRKQDAAIGVWLVESLERDRGVAD